MSVNFVRTSLSLCILLSTAFVPRVLFAHEVAQTKQETIHSATWWMIVIVSLFLLVLTLLILSGRARTSKMKWTFFLLLTIPVSLVSIYLASSTIFLNLISETKGPVHWHAEYRVFRCGNELDLENPTGLSNRVGTPLLHEHGDNWIHVEGVPVTKDEVTLHHFFEAVGGKLTNESFLYPTVDGPVYGENGDLCDGKEAVVQGFVFQKKGEQVIQKKLEDVENYLLSPHALVPPGDCIIIEFAPEKEKTDHLCPQYEVAIENGELTF